MYGKKILKNIGIFTSRIFGENSYAKAQIFDERVSRSHVVAGIQKLVNGMAMADFKMSTSAQLGYVAALADIQGLSFTQFYFVSLWVTGNDDDIVVNRAVGDNFAYSIQEVEDSRKFTLGYQTALVHFMNAFIGDNGIVNQIISKIHEQSDKGFADEWFMDVATKLPDINPKLLLSQLNLNMKQVHDIVTVLFDEITDDKLLISKYAKADIVIKQNEVSDFLSEVTLSSEELDQFDYMDVYHTINHFTDDQLVPMINLLATGVMQWFLTNVINQDNINLLGLPKSDAIKIKRYIDAPESIDQFFIEMRMFDLSRYSESRSTTRDNYQRKYSLELNDHDILLNKYGEPLRINYGVFNLIYQELIEILINQSLLPIVQLKDKLLNAIGLDRYEVDDEANDSLGQVTLESRSEHVVQKLIENVNKLAEIGCQDRLSLTNARSLSSFMKNLAGNDRIKFNYGIDKINRPTSKVLYWVYQSSFINELESNESAELS